MIEIKNLNKKFKKDNNNLFKDLNIKIINSNTIITLWGNSGSGKTTLINMIMGFDQDYQGEILVDGKNLKKLNKKEYIKYLKEDVSLVHQDLKLLDNLSVDENLKIVNFLENEKQKIEEILEILEIKNLKNKKIKNLSGGQKQRVAIARSIIKNPKILILDEPSTGLDDQNFLILLECLKKLNQKINVIVSTHDKRFLAHSNTRYQIDNYSINSVQIDEAKTKNNPLNTILVNKNLSFSKILSLIKNYKFSYFNKLFLSIFMVFIFLFIYLFIFQKFENYQEIYYNGLSDDVIMMDYTDLNEPYEYSDRFFFTPRDQMYWSAKDVETIKNINGVKEIYVIDQNVTNSKDFRDYSMTKVFYNNEFPNSLKNEPSYSSSPSEMTIEMEAVDIPEEVYDHYKGGNVEGLEIINGEYPKDYTNQILIPDFIAEEILLKKGESSYDDILEMEVEIPVLNEDGKNILATYVISGIYQTNYKSYVENEYLLYVGYSKEDVEEKQSWLTEEFYEEDLRLYEQEQQADPIYYDYYNPLFASYESYVDGYGLLNNDLIIVTENSKNIEEVTDDISLEYPKNIQNSQYSYENNLYEDGMNQIIKLEIMYTIKIALIFAIIIYFIQKSYIINKINDYAILISFGYKKKFINKIIFVELLIDLFAIITSIYLIGILFSFTHQKNLILFAQMIFSFKLLIIIILFILFINSLTIATVYWKLKLKNLIKYLK